MSTEKVEALMSFEAVAEKLGVSPHTVRRWAGQKKLHKIKLGSRTLFDPDDVARFVEQARKASTQSHVDSERLNKREKRNA